MKPSDFPLASPQRVAAEAAKKRRDQAVTQNREEYEGRLSEALSQRQAGLATVNDSYQGLKEAITLSRMAADMRADDEYHKTLERLAKGETA